MHPKRRLSSRRDLELSRPSNGEVVPEPEGEPRELPLLLGQIHACQVMRAQTANAFAFPAATSGWTRPSNPSIGPARGDLAVYKQRLSEIKPEPPHPRVIIATPGGLRPVIYDQGSGV